MDYQQIRVMHGRGGYWCQGDCVFINAENGVQAVNNYRQKLANAEIAISSHFPDGMVRKELSEQIQKLDRKLELAREALQEVWAVCSYEHWQKIGIALDALEEK